MSSLVLILIYYMNLNNPYISFKRSKEIISCLYNFANYYYYYISINYFEQSSAISPSPLLHYWSLSIENQFYIIYPFAFKILNSVNSSLLNFYILIFLFIIALFNCYMNKMYSYFSLEVRLVELYLGCYARLANNTYNLKNKTVNDIIIVLMWGMSNYICSAGQYPNYKIIFPMLTSSIILCSEIQYSNILSIHLFQMLGSISYSFYIIHYPLLTYYINISFWKVLFISVICYVLIENKISTLRISSIMTFFMSLNILLFASYLQIKAYSKYTKLLNNIKCKAAYLMNTHIRQGCIFTFTKYKIKRINNQYIMLIGDSHLSQWNNVLHPFYKSIGLIIVFLVFWIEYFINSKYLIVARVIEKLGNPFCVLESFWSNPKVRNSTFIFHYIKLNIFLANITKYLIIIIDNPSLSFNPQIIYSANKTSNNLFCTININCTDDNQPIIKKENIFYINLTSIYCNKNKCYLYIHGLPVYADNNHLTNCFINIAKDRIIKRIKSLGIHYNKIKLYNNAINKIYYCIISKHKLYYNILNLINLY